MKPSMRIHPAIGGGSRRAPAASAAAASRPAWAIATPAVRTLAAQNGVDLASVVGSGTGGRITRKDVVAASPARTRVTPDDALYALAWGSPEAAQPTPAADTAEGAYAAAWGND